MMNIQEAKDHLSQMAESAGATDVGDTGDPTIEKDVKAGMAKLGETGAVLQPFLHHPRVIEIIHHLAKGSGGQLYPEHIADLAIHLGGLERHRGVRHGRREGLRHGLRMAFRPGGLAGLPVGAVDDASEVPWHRAANMRGYRYDVMRRYMERHGGRCVTARGKYWGTFQVPFQVDANDSGPSPTGNFYISVPQNTTSNTGFPNPPADLCFNYAIGQTDNTWFGGPHVMNLADTNLQYPGQNLYPDEVFLVEAVSTALKGLRVSYDPNQIPNFANLPQSMQDQLTGKELIWDRQGIILPQGIFNQFDDTCELAQAIAEMGVIQLQWQNLGLGANNVIVNKPIERMIAVPGVDRRSVRETSGGALSLDLPHGMLWCLDSLFQANEDEGGNGLMYGQLLLNDSVSFPFTPIQVYGSAGPIFPTGIAVEWQLILHGTSIVPAKGNFDRVAQRRL